MRQKLRARLGLGSLALEEVIPPELFEERKQRFGLPEFAALHESLQEWLKYHAAEPSEEAHDFYLQVVRSERG